MLAHDFVEADEAWSLVVFPRDFFRFVVDAGDDRLRLLLRLLVSDEAVRKLASDGLDFLSVLFGFVCHYKTS